MHEFFWKRLSEDRLGHLCSFVLNFQLKERLFLVSVRVHKYKSHPSWDFFSTKPEYKIRDKRKSLLYIILLPLSRTPKWIKNNKVKLKRWDWESSSEKQGLVGLRKIPECPNTRHAASHPQSTSFNLSSPCTSEWEVCKEFMGLAMPCPTSAPTYRNIAQTSAGSISSPSCLWLISVANVLITTQNWILWALTCKSWEEPKHFYACQPPGLDTNSWDSGSGPFHVPWFGRLWSLSPCRDQPGTRWLPSDKLGLFRNQAF